MKRNTALNLSAWLLILGVANATRLGQLVENEVASVVVMAKTGITDPNALNFMALVKATPDVQNTVWWGTFVALSLLAMLVGKIFTTLWGDKENGPVVKSTATQEILDHYYANQPTVGTAERYATATPIFKD